MRKLALLVVVVSSLLLAACSKTAVNQNTPADPDASQASKTTSVSVVSFSAEPIEIASNGSKEAVIHITVQNGYHVNANPATFSYLKPTELELTSSNGLTVGFIAYPNPIVRQFSFAEKPLAVYEGDTRVRVMLKAAGAAKGASNLGGKLKVQACDDKVCYPPGELSVAIPVTVK